MSKKELLVFILIVVAIGTRFLFILDGSSVLPNFTAVGAIAIFGAYHFKGLKKWILPLVVLWLSDMVLNNVVYAQYYEHFQVFGSLWVYGSIAIVGLAAYVLLRQFSWTKLAISALAGAVIFFLVTNFGSWISPSSPYVKDFSGLMASYTAGIPFFRNTLISNVVFSFALFGAYNYLSTQVLDINASTEQSVAVGS